jgi:hypothetical protein
MDAATATALAFTRFVLGMLPDTAKNQGLTHVHFSAQPEPILTQNTT